MDSSLAESMNAQVLTTSTSASSAREVIFIPHRRTLPSMISASTRFLAQPRLIMPTFVRYGCNGGRVVRIGDGFAGNTLIRLSLGAGSVAAEAAFSRIETEKLIDGYVLVVLFKRLAILLDLNGVAIENAHGDMLPAKFNCTISW